VSNPAPTYRQRQSAETRARITEAARRTFAAHGYSATTITTIAEAAGVAIPTVYKLYGNKRTLLAAVADCWEREFAPEGRSLDVPTEPQGALQWCAAFVRRQWETGIDVAMIYAGAVTSEADARDDLKPRLAAREHMIQTVCKAIRPVLVDAITPAQAHAIISALTLPEVYRDLVLDRGWSPDDYQTWLSHTLTTQLLAMHRP